MGFGGSADGIGQMADLQDGEGLTWKMRDVMEEKEAADVSDAYGCIKEVNMDLMHDLDGFEGRLMLVTGEPFVTASGLDSVQGDNKYEVKSNCGLVSCANYLNLCGIPADEDGIVGFALENNLCSHSPFSSPSEWGETRDAQLEEILESYGVASSVFYPDDQMGTIEGIANAVEDGHAVMMGVNAGYLWGEPNCVDSGCANHQVTVTGSVRNDAGEVEALTICDSGRGRESDSCRVVPIETMEECYVSAPGASVIISDNAVR